MVATPNPHFLFGNGNTAVPTPKEPPGKPPEIPGKPPENPQETPGKTSGNSWETPGMLARPSPDPAAPHFVMLGENIWVFTLFFPPKKRSYEFLGKGHRWVELTIPSTGIFPPLNSGMEIYPD